MQLPTTLDYTDNHKGEYIPSISKSDINTALKEHFRKFLTEGLSPQDSSRLDLSQHTLNKADFPTLLEETKHLLLAELRYSPYTNEALPLLDGIVDTLPHIHAQSANLQDCSFYGLELFKWDASNATFEQCDFRHTSQHHASNYHNAYLTNPKFTLDFQLNTFPFAACKNIEEPEFYDHNDKQLTGFSLSPEGRIIFDGKISSIFANVKNGTHAQQAYNNYTCMNDTQIPQLLSQALINKGMQAIHFFRSER